MDSERFATVLGFIIAVAVIAAACFYVPPGNAVKLGAQAATCVPTPAATAPAAPPTTTPAAPKGPVIRDVPQQ